jgi:hypothetical protein
MAICKIEGLVHFSRSAGGGSVPLGTGVLTDTPEHSKWGRPIGNAALLLLHDKPAILTTVEHLKSVNQE